MAFLVDAVLKQAIPSLEPLGLQLPIFVVAWKGVEPRASCCSFFFCYLLADLQCFENAQTQMIVANSFKDTEEDTTAWSLEKLKKVGFSEAEIQCLGDLKEERSPVGFTFTAKERMAN